MGLARKATARQPRPARLGAVDHGGPPSFLHLCSGDAVKQHAANVLNGHDHPCKRVVAVHTSCVTYVSEPLKGFPDGRLMTAWFRREEVKVGGPQRILIAVEPGLPAFPTSAVTGEMGAV